MQQEERIKEMAEILGLTPETVVKALDNDIEINAKIRALVKQMAEEMSFKYNKEEMCAEEV